MLSISRRLGGVCDFECRLVVFSLVYATCLDLVQRFSCNKKVVALS